MDSFGWKSSFVLLALISSACSESHGGSTASVAPAPREPFAFPDRFTLGLGLTERLARGDLDRDGVADVAVALLDPVRGVSPSVVLAYLDLRGHPRRTVELKDAIQPREVAIADCNGDGRADVFVLDDRGDFAPGEILVYLQQRNGTFGVPLSFAVGVKPIRLIAGRWDADRTLDLLTVNQGGHSVCVLAGHGDGTFEPARFTDHGVAGVRFADAGDLNQDGVLDLALVHFYGAFLLLGSGDGHFGAPQSYTSDFYDISVRVADLNGDGLPDILRSNCNGQGLRVLEGDGAGGFAPGFHLDGCFFRVGIGDLDGDGSVDLLVVANEGMTLLRGLGDGDFARGSQFSPGVGSQADLALWDVDGDRDLDLVSAVSVADSVGRAPSSTELTLLSGKGDGTFVGPGQYAAGPEARALTVGDFVRDGVPDLAVLRYPPAIAVLGGVGDGSFRAPIGTVLAANEHMVADADLDGNTLEDVLLANTDYATHQVELLSSTGTGTFDPPLHLPSGGLSPRAMRVADLDGDLFPDLVVSLGRSNQISVQLGTAGGFSPPLLFGVGANPEDLELVDLNGDGILDAVVANQDDDSVSVLIGNGDGTFLPHITVPTPDGPSELELGDFDEDGRVDLAVDCPHDGLRPSEIVLLPGRGDGTFSTPGLLVPGVHESVFQLIAADLNRDGHLDLVSASRFAVFVQLASRAASFEPPRTFALERGLGGMQVADLDADGREDLVVATGSRVLVFVNKGP